MPNKKQPTTFCSPVLVAAGRAFSFATVPPEVSRSHLRRGRMTAHVSIGTSHFDARMEPDGKLGHWFIVPPGVIRKEALAAGSNALFTLAKLDEQPDPALPDYFQVLLDRSPSARATWAGTTTLARIDWVHWMESAKQEATRHERTANAIDMLKKGKKRVCCFDPSGFYSKALACPAEESG